MGENFGAVNQGKDMETMEEIPDRNYPEGWGQPSSFAQAVAEPKEKRAAWIEPVIMFAIAVGIWVAGRMTISGTRGQVDLWVVYLFEFAAYGLGLYAVGKGAWVALRKFGFGISMLAIGLTILLYSWLVNGGLMGMIAGGFIALVGAVLVAGRMRAE
jgi:hypothetical protein